MRKVTLYNDFHDTSAVVRPVLQGGRYYVSHRTMSRVRAALCGTADCTCGGGPLGERGPQSVEITECAFGDQPSVCELSFCQA